MDVVLNVLGSVLFVLVVLLWRSFDAIVAADHPMSDRRRVATRAMLAAFGVAALAFVSLGLWQLTTTGYSPVAMFLGLFVVLLANTVRVRARVGRS